jgi:hypothetical protein
MPFEHFMRKFEILPYLSNFIASKYFGSIKYTLARDFLIFFQTSS